MTQIRSILIANRGEIACRIIRTCKKMGIRSIAVFSDADREAPHVKTADEAIYIGESPASSSYLNQDKILLVARSRADAIHPGYGFLAENPVFAQRCIDEGFIFIGPQPMAIAMMGSKSQAKTLMKQQGVPVIEGYQGKDQRSEKLIEEAQKIGFPVLLKASAGGGGKGMRIVENVAEMPEGILSAKREAKSSFGNDELIIEKYFSEVRHIEFQIFGDQAGNVIHLLERECSIQRRHQKVIEESPSPALSDKLRQQMGTAAVAAAKALNYENAGTVEFILTPDKQFYFLEVNTRLQVEHPVTEEITGLDLVEWQINIAEGQPLPLKQEEVKANGYAIECRLYAEDPDHGYLPCTGTILKWNAPDTPGIRIETGIESGSSVSIYYDPMIAKLIAHGKNRQDAHRKMGSFLNKLTCLGLSTNQNFLWRLFDNKDFLAGNYNTNFLSGNHNLFFDNNSDVEHEACLAILLYRWAERNSNRTLLSKIPSGWRNNRYEAQKETLIRGNKTFQIQYIVKANKLECVVSEKEDDLLHTSTASLELISNNQGNLTFYHDGDRYYAQVVEDGNQYFVKSHFFFHPNLSFTLNDRLPQKEAEQVAGGYLTPMPGEVLKVLVNAGDKVTSGQSLITLSSMKMENTICANAEGIIEEVFVEDGQKVEAGYLLLRMNQAN